MRVALVTNLVPHYRQPLYRELARRLDLTVLLTSRGKEWYYEGTLPDASDFGFVACPASSWSVLARELRAGGYEAVVSSLNGRATLLSAYATARRLRVPYVLWTGMWEHPGGPAYWVLRPLVRQLYRNADALVCYGPHVADYVRREAGRSDRVVCTRQAVEDERFRRPVGAPRLARLRDQLDLHGRKVVIYVGRLEPDKGIEYLLRASAAAREDHVVLIAGSGTHGTVLRATANQLGISARARFLGHVSQDELPAHLQVADVLVLPSIATSRFLEPWGLVLNEAMAAGTAVVATDAVGAAAGGLVVDGETGLVVPEQDAGSLAAALDRLLADDAYRLALARGGSEHVRAWNYSAAADAFEAALAAATAGRDAPVETLAETA